MSSQFQGRKFLSAVIGTAKRGGKKKKDKGAVEAGGFATKQMGLGRSAEKKKKLFQKEGKE